MSLDPRDTATTSMNSTGCVNEISTGAVRSALPIESAARKAVPLARGCLDYFPAALAAVAELSRAGNDKHNPGEEMHHARNKSTDHADCIVRHLMDRGTVDPTDGFLHDVKVAWRALALLQEALEARGAPVARGARGADKEEDLEQIFEIFYETTKKGW